MRVDSMTEPDHSAVCTELSNHHHKLTPTLKYILLTRKTYYNSFERDHTSLQNAQ